MTSSVFSPFLPAMLWEKQNRVLLLQFLASELFATHRVFTEKQSFDAIYSSTPHFLPYDWGVSLGHLNMLCDQAQFLRGAFPEIPRATRAFLQTLKKSIKKWDKRAKGTVEGNLQNLFLLLAPFFELCKDNENLIFFLLKNKKEIDFLMKKDHLKTLLLQLHPIPLKELENKLCDNYHYRGFFALIPQVKQLLWEVCG